MMWLRKGIVHLLAALLLISLLGVADAYSLNHNFSKPDKLESWLAESGVYNKIIPQALNSAQTANSQDGSEGSISLSDPGVSQAATQAFSPATIEQSVNTFLNANYAWLQGKTASPQFAINLSNNKESFAASIGQMVQSHLAGLPACSDSQLVSLQFPVDPLTVACRPPTLDAKTEAQQVTQAISSGDFLNKPELTSTNISKNQPYYQKLSSLPKFFRLSQKLPVILSTLSLLLVLGIIFIAPTRRRGWRRVGSVLLTAGIILIAITFLANWAVKEIESHVKSKVLNGQLQQPYHDLLQKIESSLVRSDMWFGIFYVTLAVIIFIGLFILHRRSNKPAKNESDIKPVPPGTTFPPTNTEPPAGLMPTPRWTGAQTSSPPRPSRTPSPPAAPSPQPRRKPPKLVQ